MVNYRITAKEQGEDVIFLRKIVPGGADRSYGVAVAKLAGLPRDRHRPGAADHGQAGGGRAQTSGSIGKTILDRRKAPATASWACRTSSPWSWWRRSRSLDVVSMTPIDALNKLFELNEKAKRI